METRLASYFELSCSWFAPASFIECYGLCRTNTLTGAAGETIWNDTVLLEYGTHHGRRTRFRTFFAGYACAVIHFDLIYTELFSHPAYKSKRTEQVAPWSIDIQADQQYQAGEYSPDNTKLCGLEYDEGINRRNNVRGQTSADMHMAEKKAMRTVLVITKGSFHCLVSASVSVEFLLILNSRS